MGISSSYGFEHMNKRKKHWWEVGRVKNSDWFHKLPPFEKEAVLVALEHDTYESIVKLRAAFALIYCTILYAVALTFWAAFFRSSVVWFAVVGAAFGLTCGILAAKAIIRQKGPDEAATMQTRVGMVLGFPGAVLAIVGAVAWLAKVVFFD
jgi:hypothetical protein